MEQTTFLVVLLSAVFQASWNFIAKKSQGHRLTLVCTGWIIVGLPLIAVSLLFIDTSSITWHGGKYLLTSGIVNTLYIVFLSWAYTLADLSIVYPISRGIAVVLTTTVTSLLGIDRVSSTGVFAVGVLCLGILILGSHEYRRIRSAKTIILPIIVGFFVSTYSILDKMGVSSIAPPFYLGVLNVFPFLLLLPVFLRKFRPEFMQVCKRHKREALFIGAASSTAYLCTLWAFQTATTSYVVALRETSILFTTLFGFVFLKEKIYPSKIVGVIFIVCGSILIRFA